MKFIQNTFALVAAAVSLVACERNNELRNAGLDYELVSALATSKTTIDASTGESTQLTAELSTNTTWEVHVVGRTSGLVQTFTGFNQTISLTYDGGSDVPGLGNEATDVYLIIPSNQDTLSSAELAVSGTKDYSAQGALIADFAANNFSVSAGYIEPGEGINDGDFGSYYEFSGLDVSENWFIGTVKFNTPDGALHFPITETNPDEVYLNLFVYGNGSTSTNINIDLQEDDNGDGGAFMDAGDDGWGYGSIVPSWEGWQLVSIKLSEFSRSTQAAFGGSGNGIQEVNYIKHFQIVLGSTVAGEVATAKIAYPIFTEGAPFSL